MPSLLACLFIWETETIGVESYQRTVFIDSHCFVAVMCFPFSDLLVKVILLPSLDVMPPPVEVFLLAPSAGLGFYSNTA